MRVLADFSESAFQTFSGLINLAFLAEAYRIGAGNVPLAVTN